MENKTIKIQINGYDFIAPLNTPIMLQEGPMIGWISCKAHEQAQNKILREALEFYADRFNYKKQPGLKINQCDIFIDGGDYAREALESLKCSPS